MTYYTDQIVAAQRTIADALSGKRLRESIRQLQDRSKIKDSLKAAPARGAITAKKKVGKRTSIDGTDYVEISRTFYATVRELRSSDDLFVLQWNNVQTITFDRGTFRYLDYDG